MLTPHSTRSALRAEPRCEGRPIGPELRVDERIEQRRFRHRVPADRRRTTPRRSRRRRRPARTSAGARKSRRTSQAPSLNSPLKSGRVSATHSPQPSPSSVSTRTRTQRFSRHLPEARPERADERQLHHEQLDRPDPAHAGRPRESATYADRVRSKAPAINPDRKHAFQGLSGGVAPARREGRVPAPEVRVIARDLHDGSVGSPASAPGRGGAYCGSPSALSTAGRPSGHGRGAGSRIEVPPDDQTVGAIAGVDLVGHLAVERATERVGDRSQLPEVEPGVARHERIEGPAGHVDVLRRAPARAARASARTPPLDGAARAARPACGSGRGGPRRPPPPSRGRTRPGDRRRRRPAARCRCARARSSPLVVAAGTRPTWRP